MSGNRRRSHRRRTGSTSRRYRPAELVRHEQQRSPRIRTPELLAGLGVLVVVVMLISLIWITGGRAIQDQRSALRERVERALSAQAAVLAEEVGHELLLIDQSLTILQAAWKENSDKFDLAEWQKKMPALTRVTDDLFIADEKRMIRQDIIPAAVGQGIGAAYVTFPHGSLETFDAEGNRAGEGRVVLGQSTTPIDGRQFLMYVVRPLDHPRNWLIGASYRSSELSRVFADADLGINGVAALVDSNRGVLQAIVGPAARRPKVNLTKSPLFEVIGRNTSGTWLGETAMDGVQRLHAFHRVKDRDVVAIVATPVAEAMAPADAMAASIRAVAAVASLVVMTIGGLVMWGLYTLRGNARRRRRYERGRADLESAQTELATLRIRATSATTRLRSLIDSMAEGVAILDADLTLAAWNPRFAAAARVEPRGLREGLPLDELLRRQAAAGGFGAAEDVEAEVARRVSALRTERDAAVLTHFGPEGEAITTTALSIGDGGLALVLGGLLHWAPPPPPATPVEPTDAPAGDLPQPNPANPTVIEW